MSDPLKQTGRTTRQLEFASYLNDEWSGKVLYVISSQREIAYCLAICRELELSLTRESFVTPAGILNSRPGFDTVLVEDHFVEEITPPRLYESYRYSVRHLRRLA